MTKAIPFTQASINRAVQGARKAGLRVTGIRPDGTVMTVDDGDNPEASVSVVAPSPQSAPAPSKWRD